jgi:hypothetical protein
LNFQTTNLDQDAFATAYLLPNLKQRILANGFITILAQGFQAVLNLASVIALTDLLTLALAGCVADKAE